MPAQTAYVIMGHGGEIQNSRKIVPPGCTLVVEVHSGEVNYVKNFDKFVNYTNKSIFLDPINNYKELVKAISNTQKSLAIYTEGQEYPDFDYTLLSYWPDGPTKLKLSDSGVMEYPFKLIKHNHIIPYNETYDINSPSLDIFVDKFRNSIYPSKEVVKNFIINNKLHTLNDIMKLYNYQGKFSEQKYKTLLRKHRLNINRVKANNEYNTIMNPEAHNPLNIKSILKIKQSELFKILPPGVFYNLVCRATSDEIREKASLIIPIQGLLIPVTRERIKNTVRLPIKHKTRKNKYFIPEIMGQITEAELQRKPYINKLGLNMYNITILEKEITELKTQIQKLKAYELELTDNLEYYSKSYIPYALVLEYRLKNTKGELVQKEKLLAEKEKLLPQQNASSNNYIWEKQQNKWGKITIKNRNNKGVLPDGWKIYSTNNETWYKAPSGALHWTRPEIVNKNTNNIGRLPKGWALESNGNAMWYKGPSGAVQWTRPEISPNNDPIEQPVINITNNNDPVEHISHPIKSVSNNQGMLPYLWHYVKDGNNSWYVSPLGIKQKNRPNKQATRKQIKKGWFSKHL
jgi:hypothetical protein